MNKNCILIIFLFQIVFVIFSVQTLISKLDNYQTFIAPPRPKMPDLNIHSVYNMASNSLKKMVYNGSQHQNNNILETQYTTVDVRKLPILPMSSYFQPSKVKYSRVHINSDEFFFHDSEKIIHSAEINNTYLK